MLEDRRENTANGESDPEAVKKLKRIETGNVNTSGPKEGDTASCMEVDESAQSNVSDDDVKGETTLEGWRGQVRRVRDNHLELHSEQLILHNGKSASPFAVTLRSVSNQL